MNSELRDSSKSNSSDARVDLTAIKTPPPRLEGLSNLYIVYIPGQTSELSISGFNQVSANTIIWDAKEKLSQYNLVSLLRKPLAF